MLASDDNNPNFSNPTDPDARLHVVIYKRPVENAFRTQQEGRKIFEDQIYIRIQVPGDTLNILDVPIREDHKMRFPRHWAYFESTQGGALESGTPLSQWPILGPSQVEELHALKFRTVEQIATASDLQLQRIGMAGGMAPTALRDRAIRFLTVARDASIVDHAAEELARIKTEQAARDEKHAQELAEMRQKLDAVLAMAANAAPKPKRAYNKKPKQTEDA